MTRAVKDRSGTTVRSERPSATRSTCPFFLVFRNEAQVGIEVSTVITILRKKDRLDSSVDYLQSLLIHSCSSCQHLKALKLNRLSSSPGFSFQSTSSSDNETLVYGKLTTFSLSIPTLQCVQCTHDHTWHQPK